MKLAVIDFVLAVFTEDPAVNQPGGVVIFLFLFTTSTSYSEPKRLYCLHRQLQYALPEYRALVS